MWRYIQALFRFLLRPTTARVDSEVEQLSNFAAERGSEVGLRSLPADDSIRTIEAELHLIAEKRFGLPGPSDEMLAQQEAGLQKERDELESKITAHRSKTVARPAPKAIPTPTTPIRWRTAIANVAVIFALIGIALEARGIRPGWLGYAALGLCAMLILLNWTGWPALARNVLAWIGYGLACFCHYLAGCHLQLKARRVGGRLSRLNERREAEVMRRRQAEDWLAQMKEIILNHFHYHRARAEKAARLLSEKGQKEGSTPKFDWEVFDHNGAPDRAAQSETQTQPPMAQSVSSP